MTKYRKLEVIPEDKLIEIEVEDGVFAEDLCEATGDAMSVINADGEDDWYAEYCDRYGNYHYERIDWAM